jgi:type I restriction enzyme S subunit
MGAKPYPAYKDSGVEWIGEIPEHWEVKRLTWLGRERKEKNAYLQNNNLLSLSYGAIKRKDIDSNDGLLPASFDAYTVVQSGDIVLRLTDLQNDKNSLRSGLVIESGIITSAYVSFEPIYVYSEYLSWQLRAQDTHKVFYSLGGGLRQSATYSDISRLPCFVPTLEEQKLIASFLDRETGKIDTLVEKQQQLISLLKEKRQSLISHTVTKGLNPNVRMKDSGVEWIGEIPEHWEVKRLRFLCLIDTGSKDTAMAKDDGQYPFYVRSQIVENINTYTFDGPAVITAGDGAGVGKVFHLADGKFDVHQRCYVMHQFKGVMPGWCYLFVSTYFGPVVLAGTAKSTVESLRRWMLSDFEVAVPPLEEQNQIESFLDDETSKIDTLIDKANQSIALLKERRSSLISAAVTGKIDVREAA